MNSEVPRPRPGAQIAPKSGVGAPGNTLGVHSGLLEASRGLLDHSWSALGAFQEGRADARRAQGELSEDQAAARGGVGEGFTPLPLGLKE